MSAQNKRASLRMPLQLSLTEHMHDHTQKSILLNLGPDGLFVSRLNAPSVVSIDDPKASVLGFEFKLPDLEETIWASGSICHRQRDPLFQSTGVQFIGIARLHRKLIDDYVREYRIRELRRILARIRRNRPN